MDLNANVRIDYEDDELNGLFQNFYTKHFKWYIHDVYPPFDTHKNPFGKWYIARYDFKKFLIRKNIIDDTFVLNDAKIFDKVIKFDSDQTNRMYNKCLDIANNVCIKQIKLYTNMDLNLNQNVAMRYIHDFNGSFEYKDTIVEIKPATTQIFEIPRYLYNKYTDEELAKVPKELHFDYKPIKADNIILANFDTYDIHNCLPSIFFVKRTKVLTIKDVEDFQFTYAYIDEMKKTDYHNIEEKFFNSRFLRNNVFKNLYIDILVTNVYIANEYENENIDEIITYIDHIRLPYGTVILELYEDNSYKIVYSNLNKMIEYKYKNK